MRRIAAVTLAVAVAVGCSATEEAKAIDWDLSDSHATDRVDFPGGTTAFQREDTDVTIRLPGGKAFDGHGTVFVSREGDRIRDIRVQFPKEGTDQAYERAVELAHVWDVDPANLDQWHDRRLAQRKAGDEDLTDTFGAETGGPTDPVGGPGGPLVSVEVLYSFDDSAPAIAAIAFFWPRESSS